MGFAFSRKNNFYCGNSSFLVLLSRKKAQHTYKYNNEFLWCILNLPKRNSTDGEREYMVFRSWWGRKQLLSCGNFKTSLSLGRSNTVFSVVTESLKSHSIFFLISSWIFPCFNKWLLSVVLPHSFIKKPGSVSYLLLTIGKLLLGSPQDVSSPDNKVTGAYLRHTTHLWLKFSSKLSVCFIAILTKRHQWKWRVILLK